ncbi:MAG TPA: hypothetical protein ENJ86_05550 [Methylothermaceae bacterium]|nr:hypothetical protein [Methylothermaceae bacterium]
MGLALSVKVTLLKRFDDIKDRFMYHCHNLEHEDLGMIF